MTYSRVVLLLVLLLGLTACGITPMLPPSDEPEQAWSSHQQTMRQLSHWRLNGRLLVVNEHETWNTGIHWRQQDEHYHILITAPLGQGSMRLQGDTHQVSLQSHEGEMWLSNNPETLLQEQLGWRVPVAALRHWVLGLPGPGPYQHRLNEAGMLAKLWQGEWEIEFRDYRERDGHWLPGRVFANNHQAKVRLVIGEWQYER